MGSGHDHLGYRNLLATTLEKGEEEVMKLLVRMICDHGHDLKKGEVYKAEECKCGCGGFLIRATGEVLSDDTFFDTLPGWDEYPGHPRWRAVDECGSLWGYPTKPEVTTDGNWWGNGGVGVLLRRGGGFRCPNWEDTLEERPEAEGDKCFIPCTPGFMTFRGGPLGEKKEFEVPEDYMDFVCGGELKSKSGPYEHSSFLTGGYRLGPQRGEPVYGTSAMQEYYSHMKTRMLFERMFGSFINPASLWSGSPATKEENEMDCPKYKTLEPAERISEKIVAISDDMNEYREKAKKRIARLDNLHAAVLRNIGISEEEPIMDTLLKEADGV